MDTDGARDEDPSNIRVSSTRSDGAVPTCQTDNRARKAARRTNQNRTGLGNLLQGRSVPALPARKGDMMPKGQQKSNKEIKKPKKEKPSTAPVASFEKGLNPSSNPPKKKG